MTTAVQPSSVLPQTTAVRPTFETVADKYASDAKIRTFFTVVITILEPVYGAAIGAYYFTDIAVDIAADMLGVDQNIVVARIAKAALAAIVSIGAGFAVLSVLGSSLLASPALVPLAAALFAIKLLIAIPNPRAVT